MYLHIMQNYPEDKTAGKVVDRGEVDNIYWLLTISQMMNYIFNIHDFFLSVRGNAILSPFNG